VKGTIRARASSLEDADGPENTGDDGSDDDAASEAGKAVSWGAVGSRSSRPPIDGGVWTPYTDDSTLCSDLWEADMVRRNSLLGFVVAVVGMLTGVLGFWAAANTDTSLGLGITGMVVGAALMTWALVPSIEGEK